MKILYYLINLFFCFAIGVVVSVLCLYNWQIDQILTLTYLLFLCAVGLFTNIFINSKF